MAAGHLRQIADQSSPQIKDVNLRIRFTHHLANLATAVSAVIVFAVRDQQQRFFRILTASQLRQAEVDGVIKRSGALRRSQTQPVTQPPDIARKSFRDSGTARELNQEV